LANALDTTLTARLREVLASDRVTEPELRELADQGEGWARSLEAQVASAERRLSQLEQRPESGLTEFATALRRVETLRPELVEVRDLLAALDDRARDLRAGWLRAAQQT